MSLIPDVIAAPVPRHEGVVRECDEEEGVPACPQSSVSPSDAPITTSETSETLSGPHSEERSSHAVSPNDVVEVPIAVDNSVDEAVSPTRDDDDEIVVPPSPRQVAAEMEQKTTLRELRDQCEKLNLSTTGRKRDLVERILANTPPSVIIR